MFNNTVIYHPTGNANVRAAVEGLITSGGLLHFYTTIATFPNTFLYNIVGNGPLKELRRRSYDPVLKTFTKSFPLYELGRMISTKAKLGKLIKHEQGIFSVDSVYKHLDNKVAGYLQQDALKGAAAVYAYEDGALSSFIQAKQLGLSCLYDLPIGYWRAMHRLLKKEQEEKPEWAPTLTGFNDSLQKLQRKDEELKLADHIFVASSFTAATLKEYPGALASVSVIPYGFPMPALNRAYSNLGNQALKVLFVGGLSQRKGIVNLFEAVESFRGKVKLTLVGGKATHNCKVLDEALARHHWIPSMPHEAILKLMAQYDVFIFPSLFEGFGLVITEAMSQGTPVITTERTAGPDLIKNNENGWLIEAGNTEALKAAIENLLMHPELLAQTGKAAMETARQRPWTVYGAELASAVHGILNGK